MTAEIWMKYRSGSNLIPATGYLFALPHVPKWRPARQTERALLSIESFKYPARSTQAYTTQPWQQSTMSGITLWCESRTAGDSFTQRSQNRRARRTTKRCIRSHSSESRTFLQFEQFCRNARRPFTLATLCTVPIKSATNYASRRQMNPWKRRSRSSVPQRLGALHSPTGTRWVHSHFMARLEMWTHSRLRMVFLHSVLNFVRIPLTIFTAKTVPACSSSFCHAVCMS